MTTTVTYQLMNLPTALTVIFVTAKVFGFIEWAWWICFLPLLIPLIVAFVIFLFTFVVFLIVGARRV